MKLRKNQKVYTILTHCSQSGMMRHIKVLAIQKGKLVNISYDVAEKLNWKMAKNTTDVKVDGCGMDMGFHLVHCLASELFKDGYALQQIWI